MLLKSIKELESTNSSDATCDSHNLRSKNSNHCGIKLFYCQCQWVQLIHFFCVFSVESVSSAIIIITAKRQL